MINEKELEKYGFVNQYFSTDYPYDIKVREVNPIKMSIFYKGKPIYTITDDLNALEEKDTKKIISLMTHYLMNLIDKGFADRRVRKLGPEK